jgi:hypothetical protein
MDKFKNIGTREEVYKDIATRTAGGLHKNDIIEKKIGNKIMYISKKLSEKMKENITILRTKNPMFLKKKQTTVNITTNTNTNPIESTNSIKTPQNIVLENKKKNNTKTQKLRFNISNNSIKNVYYPDLQGVNINDLKEELKNEEAEEDLGIKKKSNTFKIEELPDININDLC